MTRRAHSICATVVSIKPCVVEGCAQPRSCRVTNGARRREARGDMVWIGCRRVLRFVACVTVRGRAGIHAVDVAFRTCHRCVSSRQGKRRFVVIEYRTRPTDSCVTDGACRRKSGIDVVRIGCGDVLVLVTSVAVRGQGCVVFVDMAERARRIHMRSR